MLHNSRRHTVTDTASVTKAVNTRKGKDMNETKTKIVKETRTVTRFRGLGKAARELGVSRGHLSYVLHGQRKPGKDLERKLRRMGITPGGRAV
jgi:DNA-binding phage protein